MRDTRRLEDVAARLNNVRLRRGRWGHGGLVAACPVHDDERPSLVIDINPEGRLLWRCWAGCDQGAVAAALGLTHAPAGWRPLTPPPRPTPSPRRPSKEPTPASMVLRRISFHVRDGAGVLIAIHHRLDMADGRKRIWWTLPNGRRGLDRPVAALPLFGSERLARLNPGASVVIAEGEKSGIALIAAGIPAVATVTGAAATPGPAALVVLGGRPVVLWPDADEPGRAHMARIAAALVGVATSIRIVEPPAGIPRGWDAADADPDQRRELVAAAVPWVPAAVPRLLATRAVLRIHGGPRLALRLETIGREARHA